MPLDDHIVYDELRRDRDEGWQPDALRLPLHVPEPEQDEAHTEEADDETSDRGVLIIDMTEGYSIVE